MEVLLLLGLVGLAAYTLMLASRLKRVEQALAERGETFEPGPPVEPPARRPAVVVRSAAPAAAVAAEMLGPEDAYQDFEQARGERESVGGFFERWVGGRLMIWAGGIAVAFAGIYFVRWSIQHGLISPPVQMGLAALFGFALLALGELARSRPAWSTDLRVGQALVGAGILVLYAAAYGSLVVHHLIGPGTAFALMAMVTAVALVLSLRHGAPSAVMGLVGGFLTPLLVGEKSETAIPLLSYLALLDVALFTIAGRRGWAWLAAAASLLSFLWGGYVLFWGPTDAVSAGIFILVVGLAASLLRAGEGRHLDRVRPAAIALVQLAILAGRDDVGVAGWGLFGLLAAATFYLQHRKAEYRALPAIALALALLLVAVKAVLREDDVEAAAAGVTALFALASLPRALRRGDVLSYATAALALLGPAAILRLLWPELLARPAWGGLFLLLSLGAMALAWTRRRSIDGADEALGIAAAVAAVLLGIAAFDLLPRELVAAAWMAIALGAALAARRLRDAHLRAVSVGALLLATAWAFGMVPTLGTTLLGSLVGEPALAANLPGARVVLEDLLLPAGFLGGIWRLLPAPRGSFRALIPGLAAGLAGAALYVLFKQAFGLSSQADFVARGLAERTILTQALFLLGWLVCSGRIPVRDIDAQRRWLAGTLITGLAAARLVWFEMLIHNPVLQPQNVGSIPVVNLLAPAYLLSAWWLYRARRGADAALRSGLWLVLSLVSLALGVMLMVRQLFQGPILDGPSLPAIESYGYSLAGLLLSVALLLTGIRVRDKALRLAGLVFLTLTTAKVFWIDASVLEGVLRILSFLFLGIPLIGIGKLYTRVLDAEARPPSGPESEKGPPGQAGP
ncbi:MAG TPA: DUF2339 domain-containing protein [Allosphingosinicella sp.]|nr:DUF2339 domain-containing protein [Allosphingosinicella sp.]